MVPAYQRATIRCAALLCAVKSTFNGGQRDNATDGRTDGQTEVGRTIARASTGRPAALVALCWRAACQTVESIGQVESYSSHRHSADDVTEGGQPAAIGLLTHLTSSHLI